MYVKNTISDLRINCDEFLPNPKQTGFNVKIDPINHRSFFIFINEQSSNQNG